MVGLVNRLMGEAVVEERCCEVLGILLSAGGQIRFKRLENGLFVPFVKKIVNGEIEKLFCPKGIVFEFCSLFVFCGEARVGRGEGEGGDARGIFSGVAEGEAASEGIADEMEAGCVDFDVKVGSERREAVAGEVDADAGGVREEIDNGKPVGVRP